MPQRQAKRDRLWLPDGSFAWRLAEWPNHIWSYDIVFAAEAVSASSTAPV